MDVELTQDGVIGYPNFLRIQANLLIDKAFPLGLYNKKE